MSVLDNLIFFNEKGYEIPVLKKYTLLWEIIPNEQVQYNFINNPKGHFIIDLNGNISVIIDNKGIINLYPVTLVNQYNENTNVEMLIPETNKYTNNTTISTYADICLLNKTLKYNNTVGGFKGIRNNKEIIETVLNTVKITINTLDDEIIEYAPIDIFSSCNFTISTSLSDDKESSKYYLLNLLTLAKDDNKLTYIDYIVQNIFNGVENIYPCVKYIGRTVLDKVSTEFVASSTIVILKQDGDSYINPITNTNNQLYFEFQNDSEMRFISSNTVSDIIWDSSYTADRSNQKYIDTPLYFSVGFTAKVEGCYQNIMAIYEKINDKKYFAGLITFLTEVEGEDERYRALLGNLGIPDPIKYPNLFKSLEHLEECVDWILVNKKSKELMLNYENIFPYAGTYKSLLNAVKFLGYFDLIFKEWYKIKDLNNRDKFVTLLTYDLSTGKSLLSKLKTIGVDFGEFERYKKLNRLTMVYHLDQIDELNTTETLTEYNYKTNKSRSITFDIPLIKKIYEYRTDEILAKLYFVKVWLENNILGVNCYIADICGEGIVIERMKTLAYVTEHYLKDFYSDAYITPKITNIDTFNNSSTNITCSLNEYNSVTFETYQNIPIESFIKKSLHESTGKLIYEDNQEYISNPIGCLILADELQYELHTVDCSCGSLYEFMKDTNNPILIKDNKIELYDNSKNTTEIDSTECPIIEIALANIRYTHGNWKSNIKYAINSIIDNNSGTQYYTVLEYIYDNENLTLNTIYKDIKQVFLYPYKKDLNDNLIPATFIYSSNNQWNVPLIIIKDYICNDISDINLSNDYVLEIIKGKLIFRNKQSDITNGYCTGAEVLFGYEDLSFDNIAQSINVNYTYTDERIPVYTFNVNNKTNNYSIAANNITKYKSINYSSISDNPIILKQDIEYFKKLSDKQKDFYIKQQYYTALENTVLFTDKRTINVNRLGTYSVTVKAYDAYNRIYVNKSNTRYNVYTPSINIEQYLNSNKIVNKKSFNESTYFGELVSKNNLTSLLNNINDIESYPKYPLSYRIYDIDVVNKDTIEYDNISYALDVPEEHDYISLNNFTERIVNIQINGDIAKINLYDGNPNPDTLLYAEEIGLCIYDNIKKQIINDIFPISIQEISINSSDFKNISKYNYNDSYITVKSKINELKNIINTYPDLNNHINAYIYNVTSVLLNTNNISVNYNTNETYINDGKQRYKKGDVIKLSYLRAANLPNLYLKTGTLANEATYRIKDVIKNDDNEYVYIIDGIFDLYKLDNKIYNNINVHNTSILDGSSSEHISCMTYDPIHISISTAHLSPVQYTMRAADNGSELVYSYNGTSIARTLIKYEGSPLLINEYIDTNYSAIILKFEPKILHDMWCYNIKDYITDNDNIYKYNNIPITIDKGRNIIIKYDESQTVLNHNIPLNVKWEWYSYLIEEVPNATISSNYIDKRMLFQSKNNILSLNPNILGPLNIGLTLIDIYGNRIMNHGEGLLYVLDTDKTYVKRPTNEKLDINIPEKSIIAITPWETNNDIMLYGNNSINNSDVIASDGETTTFYLNNSNVDIPKSGNTYSINVPYAIYYNDGTISYNSGAILTLCDNENNPIKGNKIKAKITKSKLAHKHICKQFKVNITPYYNKNNIVQSLTVSVPIMQYGFDKTTKIYQLRFSLYDIKQSGIDEINAKYISSLIYDISYKMLRESGDIENISGNNLYDVHLKIKDFKIIGKTGKLNNIPVNNTGDRLKIGMLHIIMQFYVHGIKSNIMTTYVCPIYLE